MRFHRSLSPRRAQKKHLSAGRKATKMFGPAELKSKEDEEEEEEEEWVLLIVNWTSTTSKVTVQPWLIPMCNNKNEKNIDNTDQFLVNLWSGLTDSVLLPRIPEMRQEEDCVDFGNWTEYKNKNAKFEFSKELNKNNLEHFLVSLGGLMLRKMPSSKDGLNFRIVLGMQPSQ